MRACLTVVLAVCCVLTGGIARAQEGQSLEAMFSAGNQSYESGDYAGALANYLELASRGVVNADLFYNLGNAYFESGEPGRAVLWYERALRADPRHEDARANLALVQSLLRDRQLVVKEGNFRAALLAWHHRTTAGESAVLASIFYLLVCVLAVLFVFRHEPRVDRFLRRMSVVSPGRLFGLGPGPDVALAMGVAFVVAGMFAGSFWVKERTARAQSRAVIVSEEVSVFSAPSREATLQFKVHEGTAVSVRESRPGWIRVELPGDLGGWIDSGTLERI
jgi:hypothetical protein